MFPFAGCGEACLVADVDAAPLRRTAGGRRVPAPPDQWLWTPEPVHPAIIDRATFDDAQKISAQHGTSRDGHEPSALAVAGRIYPYRARVRCRDCRRRYSGTTSTSQYGSHVYYRDPYDPANFRHTAACPPPSRARAHLRPLAPLAPLVRPHPETFT